MAKYALVIGIQTYGGHGFNDLTKPVEDAEAIAQILETHGDFVKVERLPLLWNPERNNYEVSSGSVNGAELGQAIRRFFEHVGRNEAFLYFSGHGFEVTDNLGRKTGYLVASDCSTETVSSLGVSLESLNQLILNSDCSSLVVLLDCCHAGRLLHKSLITSSLTAFNAGDRNYFLATACRSHEKAYEGSEYSLFTAAVIKALKLPGTDGLVRTSKLNQVIDDELRGSGQEPVVLKSGSEVTLVNYPTNSQIQANSPQKNLPRIKGLSPFGDRVRKGAFRAYLSSEFLPYYSRSAHLSLDAAPENIHIPDESKLLQQLSSEESTGLIVTGIGGIGKTRLMLEIGHLALAEGWLVYRVNERLDTESIYQLANCIESSQKVLLLVDYAETQQDFSELVETLNELNEDEGFQFRYVANCRKTYYSSIRGIYLHQQIDLSPPDKAMEWFARYRYETVRHILRTSGLEDSDEYIDLCRETPILAVFLAYLHNSGRDADLAALSGESGFGQWLIKRINLSFPAQEVEDDLALLLAQFPLYKSEAENIYHSQYGSIFDKLASDGWIEKESFPSDDQSLSDEDEYWITIHDVLADQVVTHYIESHPETIELFIGRLLDFSIQLGSLRSTLYTLQRIIDLPQLSQIDWFSIITSKISQEVFAWKGVRDVVLRTPLFSITEHIALLDTQEAIWEGAETETDFHNALAWFVRQSLTQRGSINDSQRGILAKWIQRSIPQVITVNLLLTWGLKLCPEIVQDVAFKWINTHPRLFQTHYLLVSWLESGLPVDVIGCFIQQWFEQFPLSTHLSFVYKAWLDAGGDKTIVQAYLGDWLNAHGTALEAEFVYQAWLAAGGDKTIVQAYLGDWLNAHGTALEAEFVYKSWLDAGGDKTIVQPYLGNWLNAHETAFEAEFVYKAWLDAGGDKTIVQPYLGDWLNAHGTALEAEFVYKAWLDAGGDKTIVQPYLGDWLNVHATTLEASFVYNAWLDAGGDKTIVQPYLGDWLNVHATTLEASFVYQAWLNAGGDKTIVQPYLGDWLNVHATTLEARFVYQVWLNAGGDKTIVQPYLGDWLNVHTTTLEAQFVYKAWLRASGSLHVIQDFLEQWLTKNKDNSEIDYLCNAWLQAGGEFSLVQDAAIQWFYNNWQKEESVYLLQPLLKQQSLSTETLLYVFKWCQLFPNNDNTLQRFTQLGSRLFQDELAEEVCITAEMILEPWLCNPHLPQRVEMYIYQAFSYIVGARSLHKEPYQERIDRLFLQWIQNPVSFGGKLTHRNNQRKPYFQRFLSLIRQEKLSIEHDREAIKRFLTWINLWGFSNKDNVYTSLDYLKFNFPDPELWKIVQFESKTV